MRVIGGEYKSRLIDMPKGLDMRPTQDKVREAVFNILSDVNGRRVLDLFAGSGAFGIEALSRGAERAVFVDNNYKCIDIIRSNLESLSIDGSRYEIIKSNALSIFPRLEKAGEVFEIIFMDPPYYRDLAKKSLINIDGCDILTQAGLVVTEHFRKDNLVFDMKRLILDKERRYGDTVISLFRRTASHVSEEALSG
jgi:16S rRNA (guanine(966)-N(2))-methyltransferase RsmD